MIPRTSTGALVEAVEVSVGIAVRTGVRELQVIAALVAHRLESAPQTRWAAR